MCSHVCVPLRVYVPVCVCVYVCHLKGDFALVCEVSASSLTPFAPLPHILAGFCCELRKLYGETAVLEENTGHLL